MSKLSRPDMTRVSHLQVPEDYQGQRVDNFLLNLLKGVPKSRIYRILRKGEVRVNKKRVKPEYKLQGGDLLRLPPVRLDETPSEKPFVGSRLTALLANSILYEDEQLLVCNKPSGLAVHGGSGLKLGLIEALRQVRDDDSLELMHRLDRETSGCLLITKKRGALRTLHAAMREGHIKKSYLALAAGHWPDRFADIRAPLKKNQLASGERMVRVSEEGKPCETRFAVLQRFKLATLVAAEPVTGRTHQIRVHAQFAGCPLVGDDKYGRDEVNRQMKSLGCDRLFLHARSLTFNSPADGKTITVDAPLPGGLQQFLDKLARK